MFNAFKEWLQILQNKSESQRIIYTYSWLEKNKKAIINPINDNDKYFQYAGTLVLNHAKKICKEYQKLVK